MNILKKISSVFAQLFMLLTIIAMLLGELYLLMVFGYYIIYLILAKIKDHKKDSFIFLEDNPYYGIDTSYTYTTKEKVEHDIKNSYGVKVGSYTTIEDVEHEGGGDELKYNYTSKKVILYIVLYPFLRLISFVASIVALFTDKFYVQISVPEDYSSERYSQFLHCYFDIVYKRSDDEIEKNKEKNKPKEKKEKKKLLEKEEVGIMLTSLFLPSLGLIFFLISLGKILVSLGDTKKLKEGLRQLIIVGIPLIMVSIIILIIFCVI